MWKIFDLTRATQETTVDELQEEYPQIVAYDESGFEVDLEDFALDCLVMNNEIQDAGAILSLTQYIKEIYFWANEEDSENDNGTRAVAVAKWVNEE